jgi:uncharacterized membrane protein YvlD (DUF360 family)
MANTQRGFLAQLSIRIVLNTASVWFLTRYFNQYFTLTYTIQAVLTAGMFFGVLTSVLQPILEFALLPIKLFTALLAILLVHAVILQVTVWLLQSSSSVQLTINGGVVGWLFVMSIIGATNWVAKEAL